ncbi:EGF domain-specific O-linked N-acetylglucosamine transferase Eogt [Acrasis kona]|uniref:EGF domain-specific O-linked N-acetylglucosamine transferase n=1 Tax=Acrasis kona TaxID=1008807 RepID=A0AAW2YJ53_9EUKA
MISWNVVIIVITTTLIAIYFYGVIIILTPPRRRNRSEEAIISKIADAEEEIARLTAKLNTNSLSVSDHEILYWENAGRDEHYTQCDDDFGFGLIDRWRKLKTQYCKLDETPQSLDDLTPPTQINCHKILQTGHSGTDNFCHFNNLYFDVEKTHGTHFAHGSLYGLCKRLPAWDTEGQFQLYLNELMSAVATHDTNKNINKCTKKLSGRTIIIKRDGSHNMYHSFSDIINLFISILIHTKGATVEEMKNNRIILFDDADDGPFYPIWDLFGKNVLCLEEVIFGIPGGSNLIWKDFWKPNKCYNSPILKAFVRYVLSEWKIRPHKRRLPDQPIRAVFSIRKHKANTKIIRRVVNEDTLITLMRENLFTTSANITIPINITAVDFGTISFKEQIEIIQQSDILIGMHGAGMTHLMWMPDESVVVELFPKEWHSSGFRNLAKWLGKRYLSWQNVHHKNVNHEGELWTHVEEDEFLEVMRAAIKIVENFYLGVVRSDKEKKPLKLD